MNSNKNIQVLIIEDEPFAQNELIRLLNNSSIAMEVLACIDSIEDAINWFNSNEAPEIVFCDIQLSDGLSFEIFEQVTVKAPVIFTTAYDQYAIKAFQVNSIDYLLKPIDPEALEKALEKYHDLNTSQEDNSLNITDKQISKLLELSGVKKYKSRFITKVGDQIKYIQTNDIAYFFADDNIVFLVTFSGQKYIIDYTLNQLINLLKPEQFYRLNRTYIANINSIEKIHKFFNSRLKIELKPATGDELLVSRVKVSEFLEWVES